MNYVSMVHANSPQDRDEASSFRDRLAQIPDLDQPEQKVNWDRAAPPVIRPAAPVARPAPQPTHPPAQQQHDQRTGHGVINEYYEEPAHTDQHAGFEPIGTRRRRRRWPFVLGFLLIIAALLVIVPLFLARRTFDSIPRIDVSEALTTPVADARNILLIGTDSREGIDESTDNAGLILGEGISGERSDTIMILRVTNDGQARFVSLPRDLWLPINGAGEQRINTAIAQGPEALINTVQTELGVPISNYVQVNLAGFIELVDAVGGVDITIENPAFDPNSGLDLPTAGTVTLDSTQALAWVRSRSFTERINGQNVVDPTGDLGRVARQQEFMRALFSKVLEQRNPATLNNLANSVAASLVVDDGASLTESLEIANTLRGGIPESVVLPTVPDTRNGNSVLLLGEGAQAVLQSFGAQ